MIELCITFIATDMPELHLSARLSLNTNPYGDQFPLTSDLCGSIDTQPTGHDLKMQQHSLVVNCCSATEAQYVIIIAQSCTDNTAIQLKLCHANITKYIEP